VERANRAALGADLVIPALALAFAAYFFVSTDELVWEAKANGVVIGAVLALLVVAQLSRTFSQIVKREGDLGMAALLEPRELLAKRVGLVLLTAVFIAVLPWLGLTLSLWLGMLGALYLVGVRSRRILVWLPLGTAASIYLLFIAVLDAGFPHGPVELLLGSLVR
jgi:hypothetical protein